MKQIAMVLLLVWVASMAFAGQNVSIDSNRDTVIIYSEYTTTTANVATAGTATLRWSRNGGETITAGTYTVPSDKTLIIQSLMAGCHNVGSAPTPASRADMTIKMYANGNRQGSESIVSCVTPTMNGFAGYPIAVENGIMYRSGTGINFTALVTFSSATSQPELDITMFGYEF